jgi:hypothetical protein
MPKDVFDDLRIYLNRVKNAYWELHELLRVADRASIFSRIADVDWCYKCAREDLLNYRDREGMTDIYHVPEGDDIDFYCEVPSDPLAPTILAAETPSAGALETGCGSTKSETGPKSAAGKSALEEISDDEANSGPVDKLDSDTASESSGQGSSSSESVHESDKAEKGKVASRARSGRPSKRIWTD